MKHLRIYESFQSEAKIKEICKKYGIENYTVNSDGLIDVNGGVDLRYLKLTKLPIKFGTVSGDFYCNSNKLTTLEGSPNHVGGDFYCADNKLTTLEGAPNHVGGNLDCTYNQHEYPSIEGEITEESFEGENGGTFTIIKIKPMPIYNDESTKIPNIEKRLKYFNDIIECSKRLQEALDREVRVQDLFATNGGTVKIWIDDIKNKGKKWGNR